MLSGDVHKYICMHLVHFCGIILSQYFGVSHEKQVLVFLSGNWILSFYLTEILTK